eukprot:6212387-Pleurochrysis_carterae.AAC.6
MRKYGEAADTISRLKEHLMFGTTRRAGTSKIRGQESLSHLRTHKALESARTHVRGARKEGSQGKYGGGSASCGCAVHRVQTCLHTWLGMQRRRDNFWVDHTKLGESRADGERALVPMSPLMKLSVLIV